MSNTSSLQDEDDEVFIRDPTSSTSLREEETR